MKPVVFLDFDNVIVVPKPDESYRILDAVALAVIDAFPELLLNIFDAAARRNLQALHKEFGPSYVVSSSWASHLNLGQIRKMLKRCGLKFVALNLCEHWCTPCDDTLDRLGEIEAWLDIHASGNQRPYVIIGDQISDEAFSASLGDRAVFCDALVRFNNAQLTAAREILGGQCR